MMGRRSLSTRQSDELLGHLSPWLAAALGLVASCLALVAVFGFLYFLLAAAGLFQLLGEWARRSVESEATYGMGLWQALGTILLQSTLNILISLWGARWGFLAFGILGSLAGLATRRIVRVDPRLGGRGSFLFFLVSFLYVIVPGAFYAISGSEALLGMAGVGIDQAIFSSLLIELFAGVLFALIVSTLAWELWRLCYASVLGWAAVLSPSLQTPVQEATRQLTLPATAMDDWRSYTAHLRQLKRDEQALEQSRWRRPRPGQPSGAERVPAVTPEIGPEAVTPLAGAEPSLAELSVRSVSWALLPAIVLLPLCLVALQVLRPYQTQVAARSMKNWAVVISAERAQVTYPVEIVYRPRTLTITKLTGGRGTVSITLTGPQPSRQEVWALRNWDLSEHPFTREYSIAHLPPGSYQLAFQFEHEGESGEDEAGLGYIYSQGGGPRAQYLGLAAGVILTTALVAAGVILATVIVRLYGTLQRPHVFGL